MLASGAIYSRKHFSWPTSKQAEQASVVFVCSVLRDMLLVSMNRARVRLLRDRKQPQRPRSSEQCVVLANMQKPCPACDLAMRCFNDEQSSAIRSIAFSRCG